MILSIALLILSGLAKAVMDLSSEGALNLKPEDYWIKSRSWTRKWKLHENGVTITNKEAFPGSSTVFVFLTDGWHLSQFVFLNSLIIGTVLLCQHSNFWISLLVASVVPRVVFEITYRVLKGNL
jgi:hypothetical protein